MFSLLVYYASSLDTCYRHINIKIETIYKLSKPIIAQFLKYYIIQQNVRAKKLYTSERWRRTGAGTSRTVPKRSKTGISPPPPPLPPPLPITTPTHPKRKKGKQKLTGKQQNYVGLQLEHRQHDTQVHLLYGEGSRFESWMVSDFFSLTYIYVV